MSHTDTPTAHDHTHPANRGYQLLTAISMTIGRGAAARTVADLAELSTDDRVLDIGCGPGTAIRRAGRHGATATGLDPSPLMLRLAHAITTIRRVHNVTWIQAPAETLPLPTASVTVVWALSSVHHWADRTAGLRETHRVLAPGGTVLLAERLVAPGARGHARHGLTHDQAETLTRELTAAGFTNLHTHTRPARRRTLLIIQGQHETA